jgi:importin-7
MVGSTSFGEFPVLNVAAEDVWDEDSAYIEMLAKEVRVSTLRFIGAYLSTKGQRLRQHTAKDDDEATEEDDDDDDDEIEEELGFISPLEQVDVVVRFRHALDTLQAKNGQLYQTATTALSVDEQTLLMELMREAQAREQVASA